MPKGHSETGQTRQLLCDPDVCAHFPLCHHSFRWSNYLKLRDNCQSKATTCAQFWIPIIGWPARVAILVTPLLNLITQDIGMNNDIGVEYVVNIHWWMIWCQAFVFLALIEYAVAISWAYFINDKKALRAKQPSVSEASDPLFLLFTWMTHRA